jgi:hypothetical protein
MIKYKNFIKMKKTKIKMEEINNNALSLPLLPPLGSEGSSFNKDKSVKVKETNLQDQFLNSLENSRTKDITAEPISYVTGNEAARYNDPLLGYNPSQDMEEIYAHAKPFTWGDSLYKGSNILWDHLGSTFATAASMIKSASKGESILDNEYSKHLAELTENIENEIPQYKTKYQRENPFAIDNFFDSTLKSVLPSAGTALGGVADMLIGHAAASVAGAALGGVGGAIGLNAAMLARDVSIGSKIFKNTWNIAKALNTSKNFNRVRNASQNVLTSLLYANGEAALQARMNEDSFLRNQKAAYLKKNGVQASGEDLEDIKRRASSLSKETYGMNLALVSWTSFRQFPSLINGKFANNISKNLPITFDEAGQAIKGSLTKKGFKDFLESSVEEGMEEFLQGAIDNATTDYYSNPQEKYRIGSYLDGIGSKLNEEGLLEFVGGAIIGGGMSAIGSGYKGITGKESGIIDAHINRYNSSTANLKNSFYNSNININDISESIKSKDNLKVGNTIKKEVWNIAKTSYNNSTLEPRRQYLKDLKDLDITEFNKFMGREKSIKGMQFTADQQKSYIDIMLNEFDSAVNVIEGAKARFRVNPLINNSAYENLINKIPIIGNSSKNAQEVEIWDSFVDIFSEAEYKKLSLDNEIYNSKIELKEFYGENIDLLINPNLSQAVLDYKTKLKDRLVLEPTEQAKEVLKEKISKMDGLPITEQYQMILKDIGMNKIEELDQIKHLLSLTAIKDVFTKQVDTLQTRKGMLEEIEKISDYFQYIKHEATVENQDSTTVDNNSEAVATMEAKNGEFIVKDKDNNVILKTKDEVEAKIAMLKYDEEQAIQDNVVDNNDPLKDRFDIALANNKIDDSLLEVLIDKENKGLPLSILEKKVITVFESQYDSLKNTISTDTEVVLSKEDIIALLEKNGFIDNAEIIYNALTENEIKLISKGQPLNWEIIQDRINNKNQDPQSDVDNFPDDFDNFPDDFDPLDVEDAPAQQDSEPTQQDSEPESEPEPSQTAEVDDIDELNDSPAQDSFDPFDTSEPDTQSTPPSVDDIINNNDTTNDIVIDGDALNQDIENLLNTKSTPDLILGSKKESIIKPQKGNFLMSGDNIGLYQTIDKDNVVKMTVLNLKNPEKIKEITLPSLAKEVTKQQVVEKLKKENTLYLKSVIKQEFGIELTKQDLKDSDLDLYIAENSLSSAQRKEIENLIKNNTIKIECAD